MAVSITSLTDFFDKETKSVKRGENHYQSGHVESCTYADGILSGIVRASMKNKTYKVKVCLKEESIDSSQCECPRGAYKCSLAAAVAIHAIHNVSRTDVQCSWKKPKAPTEVQSVEDLYPAEEYNPLTREVADEDRQSFYQDLKSYGQFTGMLWLLSPEPQMAPLPVKSVEEIIVSQDFVDHGMSVEYFLEKLKITDDIIQLAHRATIGQRRNPSWPLLRKGRLTASYFGMVLCAKRVTQSLVQRILVHTDLSRVKAINWGITNEAEGIKVFTASTNLVVQESGLWIDSSGMLGASPDGLIGEDALIEVKCPYTHRNVTVEEATKASDFCVAKNDDGIYDLKRSHKYWHQVQGQLHITGRSLCYFVVWTTQQTMIIPVQKHEEWSSNLAVLKDFYVTHIVPKLIA